MSEEMRHSYLVQRLEQPPKSEHPIFGKDNPFSFGGGLRNGGLSADAMDALREVWSFDYMGAAEFEFGAVPEALSRMAKAKLATTVIFVPLSEVPHWRDKGKDEPQGEAAIYVLGPEERLPEISERVNEWARGNGRTKEPLKLTEALRPIETWDYETCGWLELNNGFAFFTDREMFVKASALFGVEFADPRERMTA